MGILRFTFYKDKRKKKMVVTSPVFIINNSQPIYKYTKYTIDTASNLYFFLNVL